MPDRARRRRHRAADRVRPSVRAVAVRSISSTSPTVPTSQPSGMGRAAESTRGDVLVAGEAEVDEPLAVDRPRHLLQHLNPPPVVLDQVVERAEDRCDRLLGSTVGGNVLSPGCGVVDVAGAERSRLLPARSVAAEHSIPEASRCRNRGSNRSRSGRMQYRAVGRGRSSVPQEPYDLDRRAPHRASTTIARAAAACDRDHAS